LGGGGRKKDVVDDIKKTYKERSVFHIQGDEFQVKIGKLFKT